MKESEVRLISIFAEKARSGRFWFQLFPLWFFLFLLVIFCATPSYSLFSTSLRADKDGGVPLLGAQIWIEPGQTPDQIDGWFKILSDHKMPVARLFLMWNYMEISPGKWDFTLYDLAFKCAEKYNIKIVATITPNHGPAHRGPQFYYKSQGSQIIKTQDEVLQASYYIQTVVERYKGQPSLDSWMLMNEPGQNPTPDPIALAQYQEWLKTKYPSIAALNSAWITNFSDFSEIKYDPRWIEGGFTWPVAYVNWKQFWRHHLTAHLQWIASEIRKKDTVHPLHVNPHGLADNLTGYSLPLWRPFINSLGASIHPSWHFHLFYKDKYNLAVSYICSMIRGASEPLPFWVTELQGGNNLYTGAFPICPSASDIARWSWTSIGSGAERVIFWLLNARRQGGEAGEWSMLDFQSKPTERIETANQIAKTLSANADFFSKAKPLTAPVYIILSLETMTVQERNVMKWGESLPVRDGNAHIKSALAYFQALTALGIPVQIKHMDDFNWEESGKESKVVILPNITSMTSSQIEKIKTFGKKNNKLIVTGLTGFYDEYEKCWPLSQSPLEDVLGARLKEIKIPSSDKDIVLSSSKIKLKSDLWVSELENISGEVIAEKNGKVLAVRKKNKAGGEAVWIPSPVDIAAWEGENSAFVNWINTEVASFNKNSPFQFKQAKDNCIMKVLKSDKKYVTIFTNGNKEKSTISLVVPSHLTPVVIWGNKSSYDSSSQVVRLEPEETVVLRWE